MIALDVTSLKMAVSQLGEGLARAESSPEDQLVLDGALFFDGSDGSTCAD